MSGRVLFIQPTHPHINKSWKTDTQVSSQVSAPTNIHLDSICDHKNRSRDFRKKSAWTPCNSKRYHPKCIFEAHYFFKFGLRKAQHMDNGGLWHGLLTEDDLIVAHQGLIFIFYLHLYFKTHSWPCLWPKQRRNITIIFIVAVVCSRGFF